MTDWGGAIAKVAVTAVSASTVKIQGPVPLQILPDQPAKTEPAPGFAVSVTTSPGWYTAVQAEPVDPQLMPAGILVTVPLLVPLVVTTSATDATGTVLNIAVTAVSAVSVMAQEAAPVHSVPVHPANTEFASGKAVSVTVSPGTYVATQVAPQSMPAGTLVTMPIPAPALLTMRAAAGGNSPISEWATVSTPPLSAWYAAPSMIITWTSPPIVRCPTS